MHKPSTAWFIALLCCVATVSQAQQTQAQAAAAKLGISVQIFEARAIDELERTFDAMAKARMQAITVNSEGLFFQGSSKSIL